MKVFVADNVGTCPLSKISDGDPFFDEDGDPSFRVALTDEGAVLVLYWSRVAECWMPAEWPVTSQVAPAHVTGTLTFSRKAPGNDK